MTVQRCQQETTSCEFAEWKVYLEQDMARAKPEHYYLAQVAAEVRRGVAKRPRDVKLDHFMLKFGAPKPRPPQTPEARLAASKSMWMAAVGLKE
jgi:hypothetical protein